MDLLDAIRARRDRACEVRETYDIEQVSPLAWLVRHPTEGERYYLVDMARETCDCPDYACRAEGLQIWCKHMVAVEGEWRRLTGRAQAAFTQGGRPTNEAGFVAVVDPDPDDPFKD